MRTSCYVLFSNRCFTACGSVIGSVSVGEHYAAGGSSEWCTLSGTAYDFHSFEFNGQVVTSFLCIQRTLFLIMYCKLSRLKYSVNSIN